MTQLASLNRGLGRVRSYRTTARWGSALAALGSVVLLFLLAAYLLDVNSHMGRLERLIVLVGFVVLTIWAVRRFVMPAIRGAETPLDLALLVERQQGIASDLVAAMQFSDPQRQQFGSPELRSAVVDYTDEAADGIDYLEGFSRPQLRNRLWLFAAAVAVVAIVTIAYTGHVGAFLNRFVLGSDHYPTRTLIKKIASPGDRAVYGRPVVFRVRAGGELPAKGRVELRALSSGLKTTVELKPDDEDTTLFVGELARALDDLSYQVFLGDAYEEPIELTLVPLPVVDVDLKIETPAYAAGQFDAQRGGARRRVALEGSRVTPVVTSDKPLKTVTLTINDQSFALDRDGEQYSLATDDTPLAAVQSTLRYEVQVTDEDGLQLERPISGTLQVRADQPPRIAVATKTQFVLPTASPAVTCRAVDDFALHRVRVRKLVERGEPTAEPPELTETVAELSKHPAEWEQTVRVSLTDLKLSKGDRVTLTFEAVDYRGNAAGKATESERIVFQVTDRAGILAAMRQLDTKMDKKLDQIIRAQLGLGDSP